jgi:hypothetical protein
MHGLVEVLDAANHISSANVSVKAYVVMKNQDSQMGMVKASQDREVGENPPRSSRRKAGTETGCR